MVGCATGNRGNRLEKPPSISSVSPAMNIRMMMCYTSCSVCDLCVWDSNVEGKGKAPIRAVACAAELISVSHLQLSSSITFLCILS